MKGRKILISPLNWGFGHAGRMLALAHSLKAKGHEVIFGADRTLMPLIENELPGTGVITIPGVRIRYSRFLPQYLCIFLQLPRIIASSFREHRILRRIAPSLEPDIIISDSRFGLFHRNIVSVYITHQVRIAFPLYLRFLEPLGAWLHHMIIRNFDLCLIPDYPGPENLSGRLSHQLSLPRNARYMGPLSRFRVIPGNSSYLSSELPSELPSVLSSGRPYCCLILSGPEPQRSLLMEKVAAAVEAMPLVVMTTTPLAPGRTFAPGVPVISGHDSVAMLSLIADTKMTVFTNPDAGTMMTLIAGSAVVITRSGYTSVMELASMGKGAVLVPTPGQSEQEYLGRYLNGHYGFVTVRQHSIGHSGIIHQGRISDSNAVLPDSGLLLEEALSVLLQQEKRK